MKNSDKERVRVTLRQYEAFLKTVECAGVSAAAQALGVSQSALTQLLAGLERDCGFPLLVRNRGGVHAPSLSGGRIFCQSNKKFLFYKSF